MIALNTHVIGHPMNTKRISWNKETVIVIQITRHTHQHKTMTIIGILVRPAPRNTPARQ